jgi:hypothetical protein
MKVIESLHGQIIRYPAPLTFVFDRSLHFIARLAC